MSSHAGSSPASQILHINVQASCSHIHTSFVYISHQRTSLSGHVAWPEYSTQTANKALWLHVNTLLSQPRDRMWHRPPGHPPRWLYPFHRRYLQVCCRPWTQCYKDTMALASYMILMMIITVHKHSLWFKNCWQSNPKISFVGIVYTNKSDIFQCYIEA